MSSVAGLNYIEGLMAYGMAKAALEHLTVSAAHQLAPHNIAVNTFRIDVPVASEGFVFNMPDADHSDWEPSEVAAEGIVWMIEQPASYSGHNEGMARLRAEHGIMAVAVDAPAHPAVTPADRIAPATALAVEQRRTFGTRRVAAACEAAVMADENRPGPVDFRAAGLYDPDAADAPGRLALLEFLADIGATIDDMLAEPELPVLASTHLRCGRIASASRLKRRRVARGSRSAGRQAQSGAPRASSIRSPTARVCTSLDVEMLQSVGLAVGFFGEDVIVQFVRVLAAAAERVADAAVSAFVVNVGPVKLQEDPSGLELARANATSSTMLGALVQAFDVLIRHNLELQRRPIDADVRRGVEMQHRSIGFVDIVGSTAFAERLDITELSAALSDFDATASEIVAARSGRLVKLIGDEVMFAAADAVCGV